MSTLALTRLNTTIEQSTAQIELHQKRLTTLQSQAFHALLSSISEYVNVYPSYDCVLYLYIGNLQGFTTFASPELADLLTIFEELAPGESKDSPQYFSRLYTYNIPPDILGPAPVTIRIEATLAESSDLCRRIVIGHEEYEESISRTASRPIYAFEC